MSVLVDTNILLRSAQPSHHLCSRATHAVWSVATRPADANGLGFSHDEVLNEIGHIEALLTLLPDGPGIYAEWKRLVKDHGVQGLKVFDARLIAVRISTASVAYSPSILRTSSVTGPSMCLIPRRCVLSHCFPTILSTL